MKQSGWRRLRIIIVADSKIPTPPQGYGGAERIAWLIADGLRSRGHDVTLMAASGSVSPGRLVTYPWGGAGHRLWRAFCKIYFFAISLREAMRAPDAIIALCRPDYLAVFQALGCPLVYNFQNPIKKQDVAKLKSRMKSAFRFVGISRAQVGEFFNEDWEIIYNAVDVERLIPVRQPTRGYLAFLGRLTFNKGVDTAIAVAEESGFPLKIAGTRMPSEEDAEYFDTVVQPALGDAVQWIGEVDDGQKPSFLGNAAALLMPIRWDEPFGIVVAEALACGTPVIATPRGSMPELVRHGRTGFIVSAEAEMVAAVANLETLREGACRRDAVDRFSSTRLASAYEKLALEIAPSRARRDANASP